MQAKEKVPAHSKILLAKIGRVDGLNKYWTISNPFNACQQSRVDFCLAINNCNKLHKRLAIFFHTACHCCIIRQENTMKAKKHNK